MAFLKKWWERLKWACRPQAAKDAMLQEAIDLLRYDPETLFLYQDALKNDVRIRFSTALIGTATGADFGPEQPHRRHFEIRLNPDASAGKTASSLAHELRHYHQARLIGLSPGDFFNNCKPPLHALMFNRVIEADAFAWQLRHGHIVNGTLDCVIDAAAGIRDGKAITAINAAAARDIARLRREADDLMRETFLNMLEDPGMKTVYDVRCVSDSYVRIIREGASVQPSDTGMGGLRRILKTGVGAESPEYMTHLTDRQLETLVLRHAAPLARKTARLLEAFGKASKADSLKPQERDGRIMEIRDVLTRLRHAASPVNKGG